MAFRTTTLDRATDQIADGAADTADLVSDTLTDIAESAVEMVADGGEALVALSARRLTGIVRRPKALLAVLILAVLGVWIYNRFVASDDAVD